MDLLAPVWTHLTHIQPHRGEGIYLYDKQSNRYSDFTSGIGVTNTGHCHPTVVKAIQDQANTLLFGQINIVIPPTTVQLAEKLNSVTPESIDTFFFSNSGAEAIEASVKLARHATGKSNIIVFQGGFHGRTVQTMAMTTAKTIYRYKYQPLPSGVFVAPFPYQYRYGLDEAKTNRLCLQQLDLLFKSQTDPKETAAIIIEPILGEGGYVPASPAFLRSLRSICDYYNILLIMDEVQTGCGRTGKFWGFEHAGMTPDIIVMAKGLGSGMPISGIATKRHLADQWRPGSHGGTYGGGNAVVMAAASATIDVIQQEGLVQNAHERGQQLQVGLRQLQAEFDCIGDVRGRGLMVATEFVNNAGHPDKITTKAVQQACLQQNLLLLTCGSYENVVRWIPPLIVTPEQIEDALDIFRQALQTIWW